MRNYKKILDAVGPRNCQGYCFFKLYFEMVQLDPKWLLQIKCLEMFKWEESERAGKDIGDEASIQRWISEGYAKIYSDLYTEDAEDPQELYKKVKEKQREEQENKEKSECVSSSSS